MPWLSHQAVLDLPQRLGRVVLPVQHQSQVVARRKKARRELDTAPQERLGVGVSPQARCHFGQHAKRGDVGRSGEEMLA